MSDSVSSSRIAAAPLLVLAWWLAFAVAGPVVRAADERDENVIESFVISGDGDALLVPVTVDGREYQFIVDTGATVNVLDRSFEPSLKAAGDTIRVNREGAYTVYEPPEAFVGRSRTRLSGRAICIDLVNWRAVIGRNVRGFLGMEFLRNYVVQLDFDAGRLRFLKSSDGAPGTSLPIHASRSGCPEIEANLPGVGRTPFLIDTGCGGFCGGRLDAATFDALERGGQLTDVRPGRALGIEGDADCWDGVLTLVSVAGFVYAKQPFSGAVRASNSLGLGCLSRHTVTLDFPNKVLFLAKGKRYGDAVLVNSSGVWLRTDDGLLVVSDAEEGKFGFQSGIREGDTLIAIDGRPVRDVTPYAAERRLSECRNGGRVTVARRGHRNATDLTLTRFPRHRAISPQRSAARVPSD
jgi:hypothetical protein